MGELVFGFSAQAADVTLDGRLMAMGIDVEGLNCLQLPATGQLTFAGKVKFSLSETQQSHFITIEVRKPNGDQLVVAGPSPLVVKPGPQLQLPYVTSLFLVGMGLVFDQEGMYTFRVILDQDVLVERQLMVQRNAAAFAPVQVQVGPPGQ